MKIKNARSTKQSFELTTQIPRKMNCVFYFILFLGSWKKIERKNVKSVVFLRDLS